MAVSADSTPTSAGQGDVPTLFAKDGVVFASSCDVAAAFGKRHDNVLAAIGRLVRQEPSLCLLTFEETSVSVPLPNGGSRQDRAYNMDRDGFALLAMGFTGAKALRWKLRWIEAFNRMEAELRAAAAPNPAAPLLPAAVPFLAGSEPLVSSLAVAQALGRRHTAILREIDVLAFEQPGLLGPHVRFSTYLHENHRPYRCFHLDRAGFDALMRRLPGADGRVVALRDATLVGWPAEIPAAAPGADASAGPVLERDGVAAMRLGGETVLVDLLAFDVAPGGRAVVIGWDRSIAIQDMTEARPHRKFLGDRGFTLPGAAGGPTRRSVWAVGTVVATQTSSVSETDPTPKARAAKPPSRRELLPPATLAAAAVAGHA